MRQRSYYLLLLATGLTCHQPTEPYCRTATTWVQTTTDSTTNRVQPPDSIRLTRTDCSHYPPNT